ncbi:DUF3309 family protein [Marinivivus vitaminiproducens]|uniref:DUF3309 family protein n=1 Tax=Marinivivus vitaminiproducens TaxID=3035935 RepID=UPI0027A903DB|nr:DUF3309 family protein [Geminicoccaceae bacterium SCSIO 64248]
MSPALVILVVLIVILIAVSPNWGHSRNWGYMPSGTVGIVIIIVLILVLLGRV